MDYTFLSHSIPYIYINILNEWFRYIIYLLIYCLMNLLICQLFFRLFFIIFKLVIQLFDSNVNCLNCVNIAVYCIRYYDDCTILNPHILNSLYSLSLSLSSVTFAISSTLPLFFSSTTNLASLSSPLAFPLASPSS